MASGWHRHRPKPTLAYRSKAFAAELTAMQAVIAVNPHTHVLSAVESDERGDLLGRWHGEPLSWGTEVLRATNDARANRDADAQ